MSDSPSSPSLPSAPSAPSASVPTVTSADVSEDAFILDVREPGEWSAGHIPGALHIPLGELPERLAELPRDRDVVVTCRGGGRSSRAVAFLTDNGLSAFNLDGGMHAWAAADRVMTADGADLPTVI